jgi:hypothetical protein
VEIARLFASLLLPRESKAKSLGRVFVSGAKWSAASVRGNYLTIDEPIHYNFFVARAAATSSDAQFTIKVPIGLSATGSNLRLLGVTNAVAPSLSEGESPKSLNYNGHPTIYERGC